MSDFIKVTPEELKAKSGELYSLGSRLQTNNDQIFQRVDALSATWKGEAFEAFRTRIYGFKNDLDSLKILLDKYGEYLDVTHANYLNAEAKIIESARDTLSSGV